MNFMLSLKQQKKYRELLKSRFISNFKNIRNPGAYKCNDKRCKVCQNHLNETQNLRQGTGDST